MYLEVKMTQQQKSDTFKVQNTTNKPKLGYLKVGKQQQRYGGGVCM